MENWIQDLLEKKLGEDRFEVLMKMLEKSKTSKTHTLRQELERIIKEECDE